MTESEGTGGAVLIRAARPLAGLAEVRRRRGGLSGPRLLDGPGKVGQALGLDGSFSHHPLHERGGLECLERPRGSERAALLVGPRIGIDYADDVDVRAPRRFALADCAWVGRRAGLAPLAAPAPSTRKRTRR